MPIPQRFRDFSLAARLLIIGLPVLAVVVSAVTYRPLLSWVAATGLYSPGLSRLFPLMVDGVLVLGALVLGVLVALRPFTKQHRRP